MTGLRTFACLKQLFCVCSEIRLLIEKEDTMMRTAIPVEQWVAPTIWFLATNSDYRTIGHLYCVSKPTICVITKEVCAAIVKDCRIGGWIGGWNSYRHCITRWGPADFYNRKGWHSIIMQGTVNHLGHLIDIYIGWPGRVHDAGVLANSSLHKRGQDGTLFLTGRGVFLHTH